MELLRIICIIAIIFHHYVFHGGFSFTVETLTASDVFLQCIHMYGRAACSVFAMISGYFLIKGRYNFRKFISMTGTMTFYSVLIIIVAFLFHIRPWSYKDFIRSFFPLLWNGNWYVRGYLFFFLFIPFVNTMIKALTKKQYTCLLLAGYILWTIIPSIPLYGLDWKWDELYFFFIMYCTGAYIRLHGVGTHVTNKINLLIGLAACVGMSLLVVIIDLYGIYAGRDYLVKESMKYADYNYILSVISAILLFVYFKNKTFYMPIINKLAASVVGIYLIHDSGFLRHWIWQVFWPNASFAHTPFIYAHVFLKVAGVFLVCLLIDQIRLHTIHPLWERWLDKHYAGIESFGKGIGLKLYGVIEKW